jgi:F-type H+-transporting ATPase subunit epsilon
MSLDVQVITPSHVIWDAPCDELILPSKDGLLGILSGHASLVTFVTVGVLRIRFQQVWIPVLVMAGLAEVEYDEVVILVNDACRGDAIDVQQAQDALEKAQDRLTKPLKDKERWRVEQCLKQAEAALSAAREFPQPLKISLPEVRAGGRSQASQSAFNMLRHL